MLVVQVSKSIINIMLNYLLLHCVFSKSFFIDADHSSRIETRTDSSVLRTRSQSRLRPTVILKVTRLNVATRGRSRPASRLSSLSTVNLNVSACESKVTSTAARQSTTIKKKKGVHRSTDRQPLQVGKRSKFAQEHSTSSSEDESREMANSPSSSSSSHRSSNSISSSSVEDGNSTDSSEKSEDEADTSKSQQNLTCRICDTTFRYNSRLSEHMRVHTGEKPFSCETCGHRSARKQELKMHMMRVHTGEKPFTCETCGHRSALKGELKKHILAVHDQVTPFECDICGERFSQKIVLSHHINTHTGFKPYKCDQCPKRFA